MRQHCVDPDAQSAPDRGTVTRSLNVCRMPKHPGAGYTSRQNSLLIPLGSRCALCAIGSKVDLFPTRPPGRC